MPIEHLRIDAVRCLRDVEVDLDARRNYLWGANGAGKTSFLEAIYLLARGRSFRLRQTARLVGHGSAGLSVFGVVRDGGTNPRRLGVTFADGHLDAQIDGVAVGSQAEMLRLLPVHVIDPRLHQLIEAGPSERRRYIDAGVFHVEQQFLVDWRHYRRVLGQRNAALKAGLRRAELDIWTEPLIAAGTAVHAARQRYVDALALIATDQAQALVGHPIALTYRPGWPRGGDFADALVECEARDRAAGFTQVGPHRADLKLEFDRGGVRETASRGQQKLVAAALVIAQATLFERLTGQSGVLLVDDASAELDADSQVRLKTALDGLAAQQILTGLAIDGLRPDKGFPVFHVEQGKVVSML